MAYSGVLHRPHPLRGLCSGDTPSGASPPGQARRRRGSRAVALYLPDDRRAVGDLVLYAARVGRPRSLSARSSARAWRGARGVGRVSVVDVALGFSCWALIFGLQVLWSIVFRASGGALESLTLFAAYRDRARHLGRRLGERRASAKRSFIAAIFRLKFHRMVRRETRPLRDPVSEPRSLRARARRAGDRRDRARLTVYGLLLGTLARARRSLYPGHPLPRLDRSRQWAPPQAVRRVVNEP